MNALSSPLPSLAYEQERSKCKIEFSGIPVGYILHQGFQIYRNGNEDILRCRSEHI